MSELIDRPAGIAGVTRPRPAQLPSLTAMRFVAATLVFGSHVCLENLFADPTAQGAVTAVFLQGGFTGVGFFFVLSGFVLTWSARPDDPAPAFWRRRFFKIYPNHLVTLGAAAVLLAVTGQAFDGGAAIRNLLLVQAWLPMVPGFNIVAWSLSCEVLFYLLFPLLLGLVRRIRPERLWAWAGVVVLAMVAIPVVATALPGEPWLWYADTSVPRFWFVYSFAPVRLLDFVFGILLARITLAGRMIPMRLGAAAALAVLAYALAPTFPMTYKLTAVTVVPLGLVIAAGAMADIERGTTFLSRRPMVWLGEVSFAFYMVHWMVLTFGVELLGRALPGPAAVGVIVLLFAATLLLSWLLYSSVERPMMRRFAVPRR